ncbi:hypothetical protein GCM10027059_26600 [Myceligenerans halotolerans]
MAGITGLGTTFNLPNYHGELISLTPADTPFLSAIGSLNSGGGQTTSAEFEWQGYDLREPGQNTALEGATAPTAQGRVRTNFSNVCQIQQAKVSVSYTKQASVGQFAGANIAGTNPVTNELDWQVAQELTQQARDVNWSFINGVYQKPADNTTARKTRGLFAAAATRVDLGDNVATGASSATTVITPVGGHTLSVNDKIVFTDVGDMTNVVVGRIYYVTSVSTTVSFEIGATQGGADITLGTSTANVDYHSVSASALAADDILGMVQDVFDAGGLTGGAASFLVNSTQKRAITRVFADLYGKADPLVSGERIGGVAVDSVLTDFGTLGIMLDRAVPQDAIGIATLSECRPVFLNTPGKGVFFEEPLAKTGSSDDVQIYGEVGLDYMNASSHGVLRGALA